MSVKSQNSSQSRLGIKNDLSQNFTARQHRLTRRAIANSFSKSANYIKIFIKTYTIQVYLLNHYQMLHQSVLRVYLPDQFIGKVQS